MMEFLSMSTATMAHIRAGIDLIILATLVFIVYKVMTKQNKTTNDFIETIRETSKTLKTLEHTFIKSGPCLKYCAAVAEGDLVSHYKEIILKSNGNKMDGFKVISDLGSLMKEIHTLILGIEDGNKFPLHKHDDSNQIFVSRLGKCVVTIYDTSELTNARTHVIEHNSNSVFVPRGYWHSIEPIDGPCEVFVISIPPLS